MSFFINNSCPLRPGCITNQTGAPCERICVEVKKVFDACVQQVSLENVQLLASNYDPPAPAMPLTYVSAAIIQNEAHTVTDVQVERIPDRPNFAYITGICNIPVLISYTDANAVPGTATSVLSVPFSATLFVPQSALTPVNVECFASFAATNGSYLGNNLFQISFCVTIIIKIVGIVDVLIPSYGYCPIPEAQGTSQDVCSGFFNSPIFPTAR